MKPLQPRKKIINLLINKIAAIAEKLEKCILQNNFFSYLCDGQVFYDQLPLNSPRMGT